MTLQTLASGVTSLPFGTFVAAMLPSHIAIGLVEGIATGIVLVFVHKNVPHFMETKLEENRLSLTNLALVFGLAALVIGGGLSLIACGDPDGLEWSIERLTGSTEVENASTTKIHELSEKITDVTAILPDYDFKGEEEEKPAEDAAAKPAEGATEQTAEAEEEGGFLGTTVSGLVGCIICALVLVGIAWIITKHANKQQNPDLEQSA